MAVTSLADTPAIELSGLTFRYALEDGSELPIIEDLSLRIERREFVVLLGPSGCGKTTLLKLISGLEAPATGHISVLGAQNGASKAVGHVFQDPTLLPWRNVFDNVRLSADLLNRETTVLGVEATLKTVGLARFAKAFPDELSGGMRSRVALARALATDPTILLLDEPFGALDELTAETLCGELRRLWSSSNRTVLMVTHNLEHAVFLGTRVLVSSPRPLTLVADLQLPQDERNAHFMRSTVFLDQLVRVRSAFRDGLEGHSQTNT